MFNGSAGKVIFYNVCTGQSGKVNKGAIFCERNPIKRIVFCLISHQFSEGIVPVIERMVPIFFHRVISIDIVSEVLSISWRGR